MNAESAPALDFATVVQQAAWVANGTITARALVEHSLARIAKLDPTLNAFAYVRAQSARAEADDLDAELTASGPRGPLHGVPIAIKQENDVRGIPTEFGGAANTTPATADSEVVRRLRAAGAVIIGTTRMPEFGIWPYTESTAHGWTRNPWAINRSPAGSSGGSAAAVASGMVAAAIGGDGGGSIRLPASWCGLFGLKPQRGRVSAAPNPDLWRSLGTIGPLTRTVADSALLYDVLAGTTDRDRFLAEPLQTSLTQAITAGVSKPLRVMVSTANPMGGPRADEATSAALHDIAGVLSGLGHEVVLADPRYPKLALPFQAQVAGGVSDEASRVEHPHLLERRTRQMMTTTRALLALGSWAERTGDRHARGFLAELFAQVDVLLTPTTPTPAVPIGQLDGRGPLSASSRATKTSSYTAAWNVLGNPAAAVPAGFTREGLPLSVQVIGPTNGEPVVMALSALIERERPWAHRRPGTSGADL